MFVFLNKSEYISNSMLRQLANSLAQISSAPEDSRILGYIIRKWSVIHLLLKPRCFEVKGTSQLDIHGSFPIK